MYLFARACLTAIRPYLAGPYDAWVMEIPLYGVDTRGQEWTNTLIVERTDVYHPSTMYEISSWRNRLTVRVYFGEMGARIVWYNINPKLVRAAYYVPRLKPLVETYCKAIVKQHSGEFPSRTYVTGTFTPAMYWSDQALVDDIAVYDYYNENQFKLLIPHILRAIDAYETINGITEAEFYHANKHDAAATKTKNATGWSGQFSVGGR